MSLGISAIANHLQTSDAEYLVHSECSDTVSADGLIDAMLDKNSSLTRSDILACCDLFAETVFDLVQDGKYVNTSIGSFYMSASGTLESVTEAFLPGSEGNDHDVRLHHRTPRKVQAMLRMNTKTTRLEHFDKRMAAIWSACSTTDDAPDQAKPGESVQIVGERMSFDKKDPRQGVFFINGEATRSAIYHVTKNQLIAAAIPPELEKGAYMLVVRTMPNGKDIVEGRYKKEFLIV